MQITRSPLDKDPGHRVVQMGRPGVLETVIELLAQPQRPPRSQSTQMNEDPDFSLRNEDVLVSVRSRESQK